MLRIRYSVWSLCMILLFSSASRALAIPYTFDQWRLSIKFQFARKALNVIYLLVVDEPMGDIFYKSKRLWCPFRSIRGSQPISSKALGLAHPLPSSPHQVLPQTTELPAYWCVQGCQNLAAGRDPTHSCSTYLPTHKTYDYQMEMSYIFKGVWQVRNRGCKYIF